MTNVNTQSIPNLVKNALLEDLPQGDLTTSSLGLKRANGVATLVAKQDLILSGKEFFTETFLQIDPELQLHWFFSDGHALLKGQTICRIEGNLIEALKAERVALNFLGFLSGIATQAHKFQSLCQPPVKILDTRKTLPNYRDFIKKAVVDGGASNHRRDLSSAILIKENHVRAMSGFETTLKTVMATGADFVEVETTNFEEVQMAVTHNVQRIMLDNMSDDLLLKCLAVIPPNIQTEASGNMNLERVERISSFKNLDFISVGAITHSAPNADMSLLFEWDS